MATIPLIRNKNDLYYRYQMPKLVAKIEGSGNGIRTVITNMSQIAKAINRPAAYATKFFGYELGAQVKMDDKTDIYSVNGSHDAEKLISHLYTFIEKFVLCSKCENPETTMSVDKKIITLKCKACGGTTIISDRTHRLTTFIVNHAEDAKKDDKGKKSKSKSKIEDAAATKPGSTKKDAGKTQTMAVIAAGDDDGFEDSEEDLIPDPNILASELKTIKIDSADSCERFCQMINDKADQNQLKDAKIQKELVAEAVKLGIRDKATLALCKALFNEDIVAQIKNHRDLFLRFCAENQKAQKYLLGGIEKIIELFPKLLTSTTKVLKEFYDLDVIEEEVLIEWYDKPTKKYVSKDLAKSIREKAFPLIKWLKEAEVEDDSEDEKSSPKVKNNGSTKTSDKKVVEEDDDDEEDDEIDFSHRVTGIKVETVKENNNNKEEHVDDDFIDAI